MKWTARPSTLTHRTSIPGKRTARNFCGYGSCLHGKQSWTLGDWLLFFSQKSKPRADSLPLRRWVSELPANFKSSNLEIVDSLRHPLIDELRKASTDQIMMALEEIGAIAAGKSAPLLGSHEKFRELFKNAVVETQQGVSVGMDMVVAVGRKPIK